MKSCSIVTNFFRVIGATCVFGITLVNSQTTEGDFHLFTPKQGNPIEAKLLKVSPDWSVMQIQNREGRMFEVGTNVVSLDDQQYVKEWIKKQPTKSDYELAVKVTKKTGSADRKKYSSAVDMETREITFEVSILNKSVDLFVAPKVEYVALFTDGVSIFQPEVGGAWTYNMTVETVPHGISDEVELNDLVYNREQIFLTKPVAIEKVAADGNTVYGEDKLLGLLVRVTTKDGVLVGLYRSSDSGIDRYSWEEAMESTEVGGAGKRVAINSVTDRGLEKIPLTKSVSVEGGVDFEKRDVEIEGTIFPSGSGDGVIVAVGGQRRGLALYIVNREIHFMQRQSAQEKSVSAPLPIGEFTVSAKLESDLLHLVIDGKSVAEGPSLGLFTKSSGIGVDVGRDIGTVDDGKIVGSYPSDFPFAGTIRNAALILSAD